MLSVAACSYIIYQVFDYVLRYNKPIRFKMLYENVEDLNVWPDFRNYAIHDHRFLVVGDSIDIATAGIHASSEVEEIVVQTLNLLYVPMTDFTLNRFVFRLRPNMVNICNPAQKALSTAGIFRPQKGHLGLSKWFNKGKNLTVPYEWQSVPEETVIKILDRTGKPLSVADMTVTLSEIYEMTNADAYKCLAQHDEFILLPDGNIYLYYRVTDEIEWLKINKEIIKYESSSPFHDEYIDISDNLIPEVVKFCRVTGKPISTQEIIAKFVNLVETDSKYVQVFRKITTLLGLSTELVPVGTNIWYASDRVPPEVFLRIKRRTPKTESTLKLIEKDKDNSDKLKAPSTENHVTITVIKEHLENGCIYGSKSLSVLFPDYPMIQAYEWEGLDGFVWYNADSHILFGVGEWLNERKVQPDDNVKIYFKENRLFNTVYRKTGRPDDGKDMRAAWKVKRPSSKSLFSAVVEFLSDSGGFLKKEILFHMLNEEEPSIELDDLESLFERFTVLSCNESYCWLVESSKLAQSPFLAVKEAEEILRGLKEDVRLNEKVSYLVDMAVKQERMPVAEERVLMKKAKRGSREASERIILAHLRAVIRYILNRSDINELLRDVEDYYQENVITLIEAVNKFDPARAPQLLNALGWFFKSTTDRIKPKYVIPIRLPDHFIQRVESVKNFLNTGMDEPEDDGEIVETDKDARFWASAEWVGWAGIVESYEAGDIRVDWLGINETIENFEEIIQNQEFVNQLADCLKERELDVIFRSFGINNKKEETLEEIGLSYGMTRSRVQQIRAKALVKMQIYTSQFKKG